MKRIFAHLILVTDSNIEFSDRLQYAWHSITTLAPIAFLLNLMGWWFTENEQFSVFTCIALVINMLVGAWFHFANGTFSPKEFLLKNAEMGFVIVAVYLMLEMLRYTIGDNVVGDAFKVLIQCMTLLYPTTKIFKNIFLMTKGKYPPEFIMNRLYNFEKNGDLNEFFKTRNDEN